MPSVVIPAFNESAGIERCIRSTLAEGIEDLWIVVVANACRDDTAARARASGDRVIVVETPDGGKANAINLGERELRRRGLDLFPRLYLDGDVELGLGTLRALLAEAQKPGARVVSAEPEFDLTGSSALVRLFFAAERLNPYYRTTAPNGSGTYCVSCEGRARWGDFPPVIADDVFVERQFAATERATLIGRGSRVRVPRTMRALRATRARMRLGGTQLSALLKGGDVGGRAPSGSGAAATARAVAVGCLRHPRLWPALAVWVVAKCLERIDQRRVAAIAGTERWQQDRTSRG